MKVLVIGEHGQLGTELARARWPEAFIVRSLGHDELDLTRLDDLPAIIEAEACDLVINAAAYTAVDKAESEPELAFAINRDAPAALALQCASRGIPLIHVSTDYVFDGSKAEPYTEDDAIASINTYGASKAAGEDAVRQSNEKHVILRTSWLYSAHGHNFVKSMMRLANERDELSIVNDQHGCPTSAADLAGAIVDIAIAIARGDDVRWGTYHYAGDGATTWLGFAEAVLGEYESSGGSRPKLIGIPTSEYPTPAKRPANSRLDCTRIASVFGIKSRPWQESCAAVVKECSAREAKVTR